MLAAVRKDGNGLLRKRQVIVSRWRALCLVLHAEDVGIWGCSSVVEHWTRMLLMQVHFPSVAMDFSPKVNFQCRLSHGVHAPPMCDCID